LLFYVLLPTALASAFMSAIASAQAQQGSAPPSATVKQIGTIKSIAGNTLTLKSDNGPEFQVLVQDSTRIVRIAPGETSLKDATAIQLSDLQVGDRILARGNPGDNGQSMLAALVVAMKLADVSQKQELERQDWQKRGIGGIATAVDPASGSITISIAPSYNIAIKTSKDTRYLRYAPDSVKFSDAKPGTFDQIKNGDQLRARGTRSTDGKELAAEEIISGTFRNIAGTIVSIDSGSNTLSVMDLIKKKPVTVKVSADSQLRKLPPQAAQRIAMLLKGIPSQGGPPSAGGSSQSGPASSGGAASGGGQAGAPQTRSGAGETAGSGGAGRRPVEFQQILGRLPTVTLADLQKGDAVMIVSTQGTETSDVKAITLLSGVEPILTASPGGGATAALLSGWNMSTGGDAQ